LHYPRPRNLLIELSNKGTDKTRLECLRLLELDVPASWGHYNRRSRETQLRKFACDRTRPASNRLRCLKALVFGIPLETQLAIKQHEKESRIAKRKYRTRGPQPIGS